MAQHKIAILLHDEFEMWRPPAWFAERLRAEFPQVEVACSTSRRQDESALRDAGVMIGWSLPPELLRHASRLRWICSITAAVDQFLYPELLAREIVLTNAGRVHGPVVAEHAVAMMLALARRIPSAVRYQGRRRWAMEALWQEQPRPREVAGATLLVVGLGSIGAQIATLASALKMNVVGVRRHPDRGGIAGSDRSGMAGEVLASKTRGREVQAGKIQAGEIQAGRVLAYEQLDAALPGADFVALAAPLTPQTRHLIDARRVQLLKPHAYLINVSRGALVDEAALVRALRERRLGGAALDVFENEPLSRWSPLWKLPQVLITPHAAFLTAKAWERHYEVFAANLRRYLAGQPLEDVVNQQQGY